MVKTKGLVSTELYDKDKVRGMLDQRRKKKTDVDLEWVATEPGQ